jgi:hypothetical protein
MIGMQWLYNHSHHSSSHDGAADQSRAWNGSNGVDPPNENTPNYNFGEVYIHPKARSLPGKTAGNFDRQFAVHDYHDRALDAATGHLHEYGKLGAPFPIKLHHVLNDVQLGGLDHVISWASHGRCLLIHMPKVFVEQVMPK